MKSNTHKRTNLPGEPIKGFKFKVLVRIFSHAFLLYGVVAICIFGAGCMSPDRLTYYSAEETMPQNN